MAKRTCAIDGCGTVGQTRRGWCPKHYQRWRQYGTTDPQPGWREPPPDGLCTIDGCGRPHDSRGWCRMHYQRWCRTGTTESSRREHCGVDGCDGVHYGHGWCRKHYIRWKTHGDPTVHLPSRSADERFWEKVDVGHPLGCWLWTGASGQWGYGRFNKGSRTYTASHRYAYEVLIGPIPDGLTLDHLCRNPPCVNPDHLEPVTQRENSLRSESRHAKNARKTRCKRGHPFTSENTYVPPGGRGRNCRECKRLRDKGLL